MYLYSSKILACNFLFWKCFWFWYWGDNVFGDVSSSLAFGKSLRRISLSSSSFYVCRISWNALWSWAFVCVELYFKLQIVFHFQWLVCSSYLFTFDSVLMGHMFLETCPSFLGYQICCHIIVHSILFCSFCISIVSVVISSPSFFILFICVFSLFFWRAWPELSQFCLPYQITSS